MSPESTAPTGTAPRPHKSQPRENGKQVRQEIWRARTIGVCGAFASNAGLPPRPGRAARLAVSGMAIAGVDTLEGAEALDPWSGPTSPRISSCSERARNAPSTSGRLVRTTSGRRKAWPCRARSAASGDTGCSSRQGRAAAGAMACRQAKPTTRGTSSAAMRLKFDGPCCLYVTMWRAPSRR